MPIYEYRCKECQQLFEEWCQHVEDESVPHYCPICKGQAQRLVSHTSFALKGGGWYVTEYGSHKNWQEDKAPSSPAPSCTGADTGAAKNSDTSAASPKEPAAPAAPSQ